MENTTINNILQNQIPKRIFYCWFGENKPREVIYCIKNWGKYLPDYEIIEINENSKDFFNFEEEIEKNSWFKTCYTRKMWAYCVDYIRLKVLYEHGGIYLDTDITIEKSFDDLLDKNKLILGWENEEGINAAVMLTNAKNNALKKILDFYSKDIWKLPLFIIPNVILYVLNKNYNLNHLTTITETEDILLLPPDYFYPIPYEYKNNPFEYITENSYTIHWLSGSWCRDDVYFFLQNKHLIPLDKIDEAYKEKLLQEETAKLQATTKPKLTFLEKIFSIKNSIDKKHKIVTILGIKFKISITHSYRKPVDWCINKFFETDTLPIIYTQCEKFLCIKHHEEIRFHSNNDKNSIRIAFIISGGFGDCLIKSNYIYNFSKYIEKEKNNIKIDVFAEDIYKDYLFSVLEKNTFIDNMYIIENFNNDVGYDMITHLWVKPNIWYFNEQKIKNLNPQLFDLFSEYKNFYNENKFWGPDDGASLANKIALANNKHKLQILDINSILKIDKNFNYPVPYPINEVEILEKLNLRNKKYITINRGISKFDPANEGTKMWSLANNNALIKRIKNDFPDIIIVQLGVNKDWCKTIDEVDVDLVGKTTIDDIKVLIKNSFLHIDSEGGFAHLRNALKAQHPAIVLFGPTDPKIYGYDTNINIYKGVCNVCCEWDTLTWQKHCIKDINKHICMNSITVDDVFNEVKKYILKSYEGNN